jgi:hypothetical protein
MDTRSLICLIIGALLLSLVCAQEEDAHAQKYKQKVTDFEKWYKDRNPTVEKIGLGSRVGGTNVLGNTSVYLLIESVQEGDPIFEAPEELTITLKTVEDSPIGHLLKTNEKLQSALSTLEKMSLWFMYGKYCVPSSKPIFWTPYLEALPEPEDLNHVLLMTDEEVDLLKGSFAYSTALELRQRSQRIFDLLHTELFQDEDAEALTDCQSLSKTAWNWAMSTVLARSQRFVDLSLPEDQREGFPVVIPYFDFIGHFPTASGLYGRTADGVYHAELEYYENNEVLRGISADCSAMFFVRFGLYLANSPYPCSTLPSSFMDYAPKAGSSELELKRQEGFAKLEEAGMNQHIYHVFETTITEELLLRAEMVTMRLQDYEAIDNADEETFQELASMTRNRALRWLSSAVQQYLLTFPTKAEEDAELLYNPEWIQLHSRRAHLALTVAHEEKATLQKFIDELESHISASGAHDHDEL